MREIVNIRKEKIYIAESLSSLKKYSEEDYNYIKKIILYIDKQKRAN